MNYINYLYNSNNANNFDINNNIKNDNDKSSNLIKIKENILKKK